MMGRRICHPKMKFNNNTEIDNKKWLQRVSKEEKSKVFFNGHYLDFIIKCSMAEKRSPELLFILSFSSSILAV